MRKNRLAQPLPSSDLSQKAVPKRGHVSANMIRQRVKMGGSMSCLCFLLGAMVLIFAQQFFLGMSLEDLLGEGLIGGIVTFEPGELPGSLVNSSETVRQSSKRLLRGLALEISTLREAHANTVSSLKTNMDRLASSLNEVKVDVPMLASTLQEQKAALEEQKQLMAKQAAMLEVQSKQMNSLKQRLTVFRGQRQPSYEHNLLHHGDPRDWKQRTFTNHAIYGFVKFSSYRTAPNQFVALGLAALALRDARTFQGCRWHGNDRKVIDGRLRFLYMEEHHRSRYEIVVALCDLKEDTGSKGGYLIGTMDGEEIMFMVEEPDTAVMSPQAPFEHTLTYCSPPLYGSIEPRSVWEWLEYHRVIIGFDFFILYNVEAIVPDVVEAIQEYIDAGMVEITDFALGQAYNSWLWSQGLAIFDCMYRTRTTSKWIAMLDFDEYLEAVPPNTMASLLNKYADQAWMTHGVAWWGIHMCNNLQGDRFGIERMVYHWPKDYCLEHDEKPDMFPDTNYCLDYHGHRKYILNPRKVYLTNIHEVLIPKDEGVNLHLGEEMRHNHYQGINTRGRVYKDQKFCNHTYAEGSEPEWWAKSTRLANTVERIRSCPVKDRSCVHQIAP